MKQDIQTTLFQLIKQKNAGEDSLGNVLSEILSISSDAVYRRLRNETALTIQEVKKLCIYYNISFDALCAIGDGKIVFSYPCQKLLFYRLGANFIMAKSWMQSHFTLYTKLLRSFVRRKSLAQRVRAWRRA